jgi:hypothetical protein
MKFFEPVITYTLDTSPRPVRGGLGEAFVCPMRRKEVRMRRRITSSDWRSETLEFRRLIKVMAPWSPEMASLKSPKDWLSSDSSTSGREEYSQDSRMLKVAEQPCPERTQVAHFWDLDETMHGTRFKRQDRQGSSETRPSASTLLANRTFLESRWRLADANTGKEARLPIVAKITVKVRKVLDEAGLACIGR